MKVKTLIVGLGNPGAKYAHTRHNIGFGVLDALCRSDFKLERKFNAEICTTYNGKGSGQARMTNNIVALLKPQTFMNLSGEAVKAFADYYKISPQNIWIIYDDVDIPFGEIRVREGGSSAGHRGVSSIIAHLGTQDCLRFRVGIKNEFFEKIETEDFVLQKFTKEEEGKLPEIIDLCKNEVAEILETGERAPKTLKIE
ncbi:aminoacyl-tRNA hydrolase [candidate division WS5 bacterium]|uniref:Peptidyl-tRNA hydrolase n=1 Tax=candidate division WS5 bacterium TaxID=2093353 RepID=A0A419DAA8_9BACT|nr:MAG: aminoacyl-tRNA hydrolase [candidate division WS5 bacterium]